ncbi:MAG: GNAT family N-acetyltransferase [Bacteroidota bacterium]|nr:GNAT family N-acetyltransferase [Bacteroidota bacterium]
MISIECFNGLPIEHESFLIERYNSFFTTCRYLELYYTAFDINYMLVYKNSDLIELLIFGNKGDTSTCFNLLAKIDQDIMLECTKRLLEAYPSVQKIEIVASYKNYALKRSFLTSTFDDYILNLPATMDDYYLGLGRSTRQTIKNRKVRLLRDYPDVNFVTKQGTEIEESIIDSIIRLNTERMIQKGIVPGRNNTDKHNIYSYSQHYGYVVYLEIDGVMAAGAISYILNKKIYGHLIAHDNNFSRYNLGEICAFYLIQSSIEKGLSALHLLWGKSDLKKRLLAKPHLLFSYVIYRSYSLGYIFNKAKTTVLLIMIRIEQSDFIKPLRNAIKGYRRKNWKG